MLDVRLSLCLLAMSCLYHHGAASCSSITSMEITPQIITPTSSYAEIRCDFNSNLEFLSFKINSTTFTTTTLTTSSFPHYEIVIRPSHVILILHDVVETDEGQYECNFQNGNGALCSMSDKLTFQETVHFCTQNGLTYHAFVGESVTLRCCVEDYQYHTWEMDGDEIQEDDVFSFQGTHLQINSVSLDHLGEYVCRATHENGQQKSIVANLAVYVRLSMSIEPVQTVVNASDTAELTCIAQGFPLPTIAWSREDTDSLEFEDNVIEEEEVEVNRTAIRSTLTVFSVTDELTGTYRCTAEHVNGTRHETATLQLFGTPSAPLNVMLSVVDRTGIMVTWDRPLDDGHLQLLHYSVMWFRTEVRGDLDSDMVNGSTTSYIITDLLPVSNYTVLIYAINRNGKGKGSNEQNISTQATVPAAVYDLVYNQLTASSVQIEYKIPNQTGGSPVTHLRISLQAGDETSDPILVDIPDAIPKQLRSYMLEGLKGGTPYTAKISVGNSIGFGPAKEIKFFTVRPGYPATPTFVRTSDVGSTSVKLSWTVVDVGRPYTEYCISVAVVEEGGSSGAEGEVFTVDAKDVQVIGDEESTEISELEPATCYVFTVTIKNKEGSGSPSLPVNATCTLTCNEENCKVSGGLQDPASGPSNAQLIPILIVTVVVAIGVILAVILVAILSRRYSHRRKSDLNIVSSFNNNLAPTSSLSSSHLGSSVERSFSSVSSSLAYNRQQSQTSSSAGDSEEAPTTGSSIVSDNPFIFGPSQFQNGILQHHSRQPHLNQNGASTMPSVSVSYSNMVEQQQQQQPLGAGTRSYPLFSIPEHTVAVAHQAQTLPNRARPQEEPGTVMTDNPAFGKPPGHLPISSQYNNAASELSDPEDATPPPIPPYLGKPYPNSSPSTSSQPAPQIHVHTHFQTHAPIPPRSQSTQSVPYLGESYSQASRSPAMPRPPEFFFPDEEEDEVEFMDNDAYESATPQPHRRDFLSQDTPTYSHLTTTAVPPRGRSSSPVLPPRRGSSQSEGGPPSGGLLAGGDMDGPKFEISRQKERGRGAVFEQVTMRSCV